MGRVCHYKGKLEGFLKDDGTVLYPVCGGGYANVHVLKFIELDIKKFFYHMLIKTKQKPCGSQSQGGLRRSSAPCIYGLCSPLEQGWPVGPIKMAEATVNDF